MTYSDLFQATPATLIPRGHKPITASVGFYWANTRPAELTLTVRCGTEYEVWSVGRSLFIAADQEWAQGAWVGGGDFGVCFTGERAMLSFKPAGTGEHAVVVVPAAVARGFIEHTRRIVDAGEAESAVTLQRVEEAIAQILGSD